MITELHNDVKKGSNSVKAKILAGFFKTGKGQYGEGDIFYGLTVSQSREIAKRYSRMSLDDISILLKSEIHEERLIALLILVIQFQTGDEKVREKLFDFYLSKLTYINNWDLVDLSADKIVGEFLYFESKKNQNSKKSDALPKDAYSILGKMSSSVNLWEKRIAIVATFAFIKRGNADLTFTIADILMSDSLKNKGQIHDLLQKAVGWMLREVGKRVSEKDLEDYLMTRYQTLPRTTLRYAIERFPEGKRKKYLLGAV